jgi:Ser/Thr protein kinase RdoA (MazF antagonist)
MDTTPPLFLVWARQALQAYDLHAPTVTYLGQSENITFRLAAEPAGARFLLRLHRPRTQAFAGLRQQPAAIQSELAWLSALAQDTAIPVPRPLRNRHGAWVTVLQPAHGPCPLHPGNCLVTGDAVCPIDFSLCGFGYYLFDLATCLGSLDTGVRQPLLDAYGAQRSLPPGAVRLLEAFLIISRMSFYGLALPDPGRQAWLQRRIPQVAETICRPFLQGKTFLFAAR